MTWLHFWVPGVPAPQGSKIRTRYGMREASAKVKPWREAVKHAAMTAMDDDDDFQPIEQDGVHLRIRFIFKRPQSHYGTGNRWNILKERFANARMTRKPDVDKLCRATMDALTEAGVWADDSQVCDLQATKKYGNDRTVEGAWIYIDNSYNKEH